MGEGARCPWAKTEHEILYHDTEWCRPCRDDRALFELLELEGFQAELEADSGAAGGPAGGLRGF